MLEVLLNTGSTIDEGRLAKGGSKLTEDYTKECAVCDVNPRDYAALGSPEKVRVTSRDGRYSVVVYLVLDSGVPKGQAFMPRAIWANVVVEPETFSTGSPLYKGSPVILEPSQENVLSAEEVVIKLYMGAK